MNLCQSERAIKAREWRARGREKRRFDTLLSNYTNVKHKDIYKKCTEFYRSLNRKYPKKHDLTKTKEYRRWKSQATWDLEISDDHNSSSDEAEPVSEEHVSDEAEPVIEEHVSDEAEPVIEEHVSDETEPVIEEHVSDEAEPVIEEHVSDEAEPVIEEHVSDETEPVIEEHVSDEAEPVRDLIQLAAGDLIPNNPELQDNIDSIIDDIVRELQQDADIRDWVNDQLGDEDEGIGMNVDTDPLDYLLETEDVDW